jgi:hypothetical protein
VDSSVFRNLAIRAKPNILQVENEIYLNEDIISEARIDKKLTTI